MNKYPFAAALLLISACAHEDTDLDVEACTLIKATPVPITAAPTQAGAPEIALGENAYDVKTSSTAKTYLRVEVTSPTGAVLYLSLDGVSTLAGGSPNAQCPADIPDHHELELDTVGPYYLELNPAATNVTIVVHPESGEHGH